MSSGMRPQNDEFGHRLPRSSQENQAHQQQQQMLAWQNQANFSSMGYANQLPATNANNYQTENHPMATNSSSNNPNWQSGQPSTSGAQQFVPGLTTNQNLVQQFGGVPSSNMNTQLNQNPMMLWNLFNAMS